MYEDVEKAFSRQSEIFDFQEEQNEILKWMRSLTRAHVAGYLRKGDEILELNAGTGLDAVFFAGKGHSIHCIDISKGMTDKLSAKVKEKKLDSLISHQLLSFDQLDKLEKKPFDFIFSNFGGLNCTEDLSGVFSFFPKILRPGGRISFVIMPQISPWELMLALKGKFNTAFRRFQKGGITANIEGVEFTTYYHNAGSVKNALGKDFKVLEIQGLGSFSPPPFMGNFPKRYPRFYKMLTGMDEKLSKIFPFNRCADHFIFTAEYVPGSDYDI